MEEGHTNKILDLIPHTRRPLHPLLLRLPALRLGHRMGRSHIAQQLDGELGEPFGFLAEEVELLLLVAGLCGAGLVREREGEREEDETD